MRKRYFSIALLAWTSSIALGQTAPAPTTTLPKEWGAAPPRFAPPSVLMAPRYLNSSGQTNLNQASFTLLNAQTAAIASLADRVEKLETRIKELEAQVPGTPK
ncbi:hypothetical protein D3C86_1353780 [compost metagenome]